MNTTHTNGAELRPPTTTKDRLQVDAESVQAEDRPIKSWKEVKTARIHASWDRKRQQQKKSTKQSAQDLFIATPVTPCYKRTGWQFFLFLMWNSSTISFLCNNCLS
jgi:hypothetical protein